MNIAVPMASPNKRCVLYARYSSDLQNDKSIDDQFASLRERANQLGWTIVEEYADRALSGTSLKRESLLRLMEDAKFGKFDVVLTEGLDRVSRNQVDSHFFFQSLEFVDVKIYTLADGGFLDAMHVTFRSLQHSQYIKTLGLNVRRGQVGVVRSGRGVGRPPYGYKIVRSFDQVKGVWEIDEGQAPVVLRIFKQLAAGKSALAIARELNDDGVPFPNTRHKDRQQQWRQDQILGSRGRKQGIARNPLYRGEYIWGKSKVRRAPDGSVVSRIAAESDRSTFLRPDLRIVPDDLWDAVQKRLKKSSGLPLNRRRRPPHLLSGLIWCGWCDDSYVVGAHDRVRCSGRVEKGTCKNTRSILRSEIETAILNALSGQLLRDELVDEYVREYKIAQERERSEHLASSKSARKREALLLRERQHFVDKIASGKAEGAIGDFILEEVRKRTVELDRLRAEATTPVMPPLLHDGLEIANRFRAQIANLRGSLSGSGADVIQAREAIRGLIDRIVITPVGTGNKRGSGPVSIKIQGKLAALVGLGEFGTARSVQLDSNIPTQQDLTKRTWTVTTTIQNDPPLAGRHMDRAAIVSALEGADAPLPTSRLIESAARAAGGATDSPGKSIKSRVKNCLAYMLKEGTIVGSNVPVGHSRQRQWVLPERQQEFWPSGPPAQEGGHVDTQHVLAALREATDLVTSAEITWRVLDAYREDERKPPFEEIRLRVRRCLDFHRQRGTVRSVARPGNRNIGWVLAEREHEFCPPNSQQPDAFVDTPGVLAALRTTQKPMTCREIAVHMLTAEGKKLRAHEIRSLASRIWGCLHYHASQGTVREITLPGRSGRSRAWVLASVTSAYSDYQSTDDARVMSILSSASAPMIVPEIVKSLLSLRADTMTERNVRLATARVLAYLRRFRAQGLAHDVRIEGSRFAGWLLTDSENRSLVTSDRQAG